MTERISVTFVTNVIPPFFRQCVSSSLLPVSYVETTIMTTNWHRRRLFADQVENRTKSLWRVRPKQFLTHLFRRKKKKIFHEFYQEYVKNMNYIRISCIQLYRRVIPWTGWEKVTVKTTATWFYLHAFGSVMICKSSSLKFTVKSFSVPSYSTRLFHIVARIKIPKGVVQLDRSLGKER